MRKALILLVAFALVGVTAFAAGTASWSINTYTGFGIVMENTTPAVNAVFPYDFWWAGGGTGATRLGFKYTSEDGNAGFNSRLQMATPLLGAIATFNQLNAWAKLFGGMVTVRAGIGDDYTIATTDWYSYGNTDGKLGLFLDVTPISGLDIGVFAPIPAVPAILDDMATGFQVGFAYAMKDIGSIQAGTVLAKTQGAATGTSIYFGVKVTAIKDLTAILEGQATLGSTTTPIQLFERLGYNMGALSITARIGELLSGSTFDWGVEPLITYKVNDNLSVNAIANVYSSTSQTWYGPEQSFGTGTIPAIPGFGSGAANSVNFGGGAFLSWAASGFTVTVGDYYVAAAAPNGGNIIFVNADLAL